MRKFNRLAIWVLMLVPFTMAMVCANPLEPLKKDKLSNARFESVLFGRVRFTTTVPKFNTMGKAFKFEMTHLADGKKSTFTIPIKALSERIKDSESGITGYETPFMIQAEPGAYRIDRCEYDFENLDLKKITTFVGNVDYYYIDKVWVNLGKDCPISPGNLVYLGVIDCVITEISVDPGNRYSWRTDLHFSDSDYEKDLQEFQTSRPKLFEQFKDAVVKAPWYEAK